MDIFNELKVYLSERGAGAALPLIDQFLVDRGANTSTEEFGNIVVAEACKLWGVPIPLIKSKSKKREFVTVREFICKYLYDNSAMSLKAIGMLIGGRNHATILNSKDECLNHIQTESHYRRMWKEFLFRLGVEFYIEKPVIRKQNKPLRHEHPM